MEKAVTITSFRSPFEIFLLAACILGGFGGLLNPTGTSPAVSNVLPGWLLTSWYVGLIVGGACALAGTLLHQVISLHIERIGLTLIVGLCVLYGFSVIAGGGYPFVFAAMLVVSFAVACFYRIRQIRRDIRRITDEVAKRK